MEGTKYPKNKDCRQCKYEDHCPGLPVAFRTNATLRASAIHDLPEEVVLEVTQRCNSDCRACFIQKQSREIPLAKMKKVINECARLGIKVIRLTGGETLLYSHIEKALSYAKERNLRVILNTNGTILDKKIKVILKNYVDNILVSLRGFNAPSEKWLTRSAIGFKEKIKNITDLNHLIPGSRIGTVISRTLIDNLPKYHNLIKKMGIKNWELYRPMVAHGDNEFAINRVDLLKIMYYLKEIKSEGRDIKIANPVPFCITPDLDLSSYALLGGEGEDGHKRIVFDVGGFLKPSYSINKNLGQEIEVAWLSPFLKKMRSLSYLPKKCKICFYLKWCKGGSRYWAKVINRDYFAPDPLMETGN